MKKILTLILGLLAFQLSHAQTDNANKVTIGSSYINNAYIDVHPYQSGATPAIDNSIHFKLNVGTKFKINAVMDSGGTIQGYVITPWKYNDMIQKTPGDTATRKSFFYNNIAASGKLRAKVLQLKDSLTKKQAEIKAAQEQLLLDSIKLAQTRSTVDTVKKEVAQNHKQLVAVTANLDTKRIAAAIPKTNKTASRQLTSFIGLQNAVKAQISGKAKPDSIVKFQLVTTAAVLPIGKNPAFIQARSAYATSENRLRNAAKAYYDTKENYQDNINELAEKIQEATVIGTSYRDAQLQTNPNRPDPNAYKITKQSINDKLDAPTDTSDRATLYDQLAYLDSWANGWLFFISAKDFSDNCVLIYPSSHKFTWGFLTLPVKMRFDNSKGGRFDFEQNLNFGLTFGDKHQLISTNDVSLNYLLGLSVVNVPLNDATPQHTATSTAAISTSIGLMFQYDKFQIGAFLGQDFAGAHANQFNYQGKPWIGFAIGVSLFGEGKTTSSTQTQDSGKP